MKVLKSLPFRLFLGILVGAIIGLMCRNNPDATTGVM